MRDNIKDPAAKTVRLAGDYERALIIKDWDTIFSIEKELRNLFDALPDYHIPGLICRGRNIVRKHRGLGEVVPN